MAVVCRFDGSGGFYNALRFPTFNYIIDIFG